MAQIFLLNKSLRICMCMLRSYECSACCVQLAAINPRAVQPNRPVSLCHPLQSVDTVCTLYQSFQEGTGSGPGGLMDDAKEPPARQGGVAAGQTSPHRPCHKHMSATERLRKVIQELVDTEKSYVKVRPQSFECCHIRTFQKKPT